MHICPFVMGLPIKQPGAELEGTSVYIHRTAFSVSACFASLAWFVRQTYIAAFQALFFASPQQSAQQEAGSRSMNSDIA